MENQRVEINEGALVIYKRYIKANQARMTCDEIYKRDAKETGVVLVLI